jgi:hypothetical protein
MIEYLFLYRLENVMDRTEKQPSSTWKKQFSSQQMITEYAGQDTLVPF